MDRGAWFATVLEVTKSWTQLNKHSYTSVILATEVDVLLIYLVFYYKFNI